MGRLGVSRVDLRCRLQHRLRSGMLAATEMSRMLPPRVRDVIVYLEEENPQVYMMLCDSFGVPLRLRAT